MRPEPASQAFFRKLNTLVSCDVRAPTVTLTASLLPLVRLREHVIAVSVQLTTLHGVPPTVTAYSVLDEWSRLDVLLVPLASFARSAELDTKPLCLLIKASWAFSARATSCARC